MMHARMTAILVITLVTACGTPPGDKETAAQPAIASSACGERGQPLCPTQAWMKATLQASLLAGDLQRVARYLETVADRAPDGYDDWAAIALRGADAAAAGRIEDVKASCKACHDLHRRRFREQHRGVPIFVGAR
jgi:hypothetical protein